MGVDGTVLERIAKIMQYLRLGSGKVLDLNIIYFYVLGLVKYAAIFFQSVNMANGAIRLLCLWLESSMVCILSLLYKSEVRT